MRERLFINKRREKRNIKHKKERKEKKHIITKEKKNKKIKQTTKQSNKQKRDNNQRRVFLNINKKIIPRGRLYCF